MALPDHAVTGEVQGSCFPALEQKLWHFLLVKLELAFVKQFSLKKPRNAEKKQAMRKKQAVRFKLLWSCRTLGAWRGHNLPRGSQGSAGFSVLVT